MTGVLDPLTFWCEPNTATFPPGRVPSLFSATMSNADFVNVIYKNVLGRKDGADAGGLAYWTGKLADKSETRGSLVSTILDSAHSFKGNKDFGYVADLLDNKNLVAKTFAIDLGLNYNTSDASITNGMAIAAAVTPARGGYQKSGLFDARNHTVCHAEKKFPVAKIFKWNKG